MKVFATLLAILCLAPQATACDYTVRDIGFVEFAPPRMRLIVLFHDRLDETSLRQAQHDLNEQALESNCRAWNLKFQCGTLANIREPTEEQRAWLNESPLDWSCWLVRQDGKSRLLEEALLAQRPEWDQLLADHLQLPWSQTFREQALDSFAQLLLFESTDAEANEAAEAVIAQAIAALGKAASLLPRPITDPVRVIRLRATEEAPYATLLWTMQIQERAAGEPCLGTLYGRGLLAGPAMRGNGIAVEALLAQLVLVGQSCECGTERNWVQYPRLPIAWNETMHSDMAHHLGFDPQSSLVIDEVKRIIQRGPQSLLNGNDDVSAVVNSALAIEGSQGLDGLSATVIQGDGWGFPSPAALQPGSVAGPSVKLLAIPPGHTAPESTASGSTAELRAAADNRQTNTIAHRSPNHGISINGATLDRAASGRRGWILATIAVGSCVCLFFTLRRFKARGILGSSASPKKYP